MEPAVDFEANHRAKRRDPDDFACKTVLCAVFPGRIIVRCDRDVLRAVADADRVAFGTA